MDGLGGKSQNGKVLIGPLSERMWFVLILLGSFIARIIHAMGYSVQHPDEIYQYLEPAHRLLYGYGAITWEWRDGIRSWLPAVIFAVPMKLGEWIAPDTAAHIYAPRLMMAFWSLILVWAAWRSARRHSPMHGLIAAVIAALWVEFIIYSAHPLTELMATFCIIPALVLAGEDKVSRNKYIMIGFLLGLGVVFRPHYAPAVGIGAIMIAGMNWRERWIPMIAGGLVAILISGAVDIAFGQYPFEWFFNNYQRNVVDNVAARYGVSPFGAYFGFMAFMLSVPLLVILALLTRLGAKGNALLITVALVNILVHSFIGHKEYRFIALSMTALVFVAAQATGHLAQSASIKWPRWPQWTIVIFLLALWLGASIWRTPIFLRYDQLQTPMAAQAMDHYRNDPELCGFGMLGFYFSQHGGYSRLHRNVPIIVYQGQKTTVRPEYFNRAVARRKYENLLGPDFKRVSCSLDDICMYERPGGCAAGSSPDELNAFLKRNDM